MRERYFGYFCRSYVAENYFIFFSILPPIVQLKTIEVDFDAFDLSFF